MPRSAPLFLAGPTGVGKSELALCLARQVNGEIIAVDSVQVYRGMDIGTAKPSRADQEEVPHHLIDILDLNQAFDVAQFVARATMASAKIQERGKVPIFCGGTGLYLKAYLFGLGGAPAGSPALREELEQTPLAELLDEIARRDPVTYGKIDRNNPRRVIRAVEVIRLTGKAFSDQRAPWERVPSSVSAEARVRGNLFAFERSRDDLNARIERRVEQMFHLGLVDETRNLLRAGLEQNAGARNALGYRQVVDHLKTGVSLEETKSLVKQKTRQYAKRQMTWLRHQLPVRWIQLQAAQKPEQACQEVVRGYDPEFSAV